MMESLVQWKLHAGFGGEDAETGVSKGARTRCVLTQSLSERKDSYQLHERTQLQVNPETGQVIAATMVANQRVKSVTYLQQKRDLPDIKAELRDEYQDIHSQVLQDVLLRLDRAFKAFFRRIENGQTPGFPVRRIVGSY